MRLNAAKYVQLISEGLFIYFIMVPIFVFQDHTLPLWSYISLVILTVVLTDISRQLTERFIIYLPILAIILVIGIFAFSYPILIPFFLGVILFWREARFTQDGRSEQPLLMVALSAALILIEIIFVGDTTLIWMGLIQFLAAVIGQWLLFLLSYSTLKQHMRNLFIGSTSAVIGGGVILYFLFPIVSQSASALLSGVGWSIEAAGVGITRLFGLENMEMPELRQDSEGEESEELVENFDFNNMDKFKADPDKETDSGLSATDFLNIWTILGLVLILGIVSFIFYRKKRKQTPAVATGVAQQATYSSAALDKTKSSHRNKQQYTEQSAPNSPVREQVFEFEGEAINKGYGRKAGETVEEWLLRLGFDASELNMYQKVRYGKQTLTDQEYQQFEQRLNDLQKRLRQL